MMKPQQSAKLFVQDHRRRPEAALMVSLRKGPRDITSIVCERCRLRERWRRNGCTLVARRLTSTLLVSLNEGVGYFF